MASTRTGLALGAAALLTASVILGCPGPAEESFPEIPSSCDTSDPRIEVDPSAWRQSYFRGGGGQGASTEHLEPPVTVVGVRDSDIVDVTLYRDGGELVDSTGRLARRLSAAPDDLCARRPRVVTSSPDGSEYGRFEAEIVLTRDGVEVQRERVAFCAAPAMGDAPVDCAEFETP